MASVLLRIATHSAWSAVGCTAARLRVTATSSPAANGLGVTSIGSEIPSIVSGGGSPSDAALVHPRPSST